MREKTLQLAGRVGDGAILTEMSSPAYVRWAREQVTEGLRASSRTETDIVVFSYAKIGTHNRDYVRQVLAKTLSWASPHLQPLGILDEVQALYRDYGEAGVASRLNDAWVDALSISGTPDDAAEAIYRLAEAGATSIVLQPPDGDPTCLDEYIHDLMPLLKR